MSEIQNLEQLVNRPGGSRQSERPAALPRTPIRSFAQILARCRARDGRRSYFALRHATKPLRAQQSAAAADQIKRALQAFASNRAPELPQARIRR